MTWTCKLPRWIVFLIASFPASAFADGVHFSGLYVPAGLTCDQGAEISEEFGNLRAGYLIYDDQGRKSDDADCEYVQVQALRGTSLQIVDLKCSYDGSSYEYRQVLTPLSDNRMLVINNLDDGTSSYQVYTYCGWVPVNRD